MVFHTSGLSKSIRCRTPRLSVMVPESGAALTASKGGRACVRAGTHRGAFLALPEVLP